MSLYELFVGFRYLKSKKSQKFISFNTVLSVLIVSLGVFILINAWGVRARIENVASSPIGLWLFWPGGAAWQPARGSKPI